MGQPAQRDPEFTAFLAAAAVPLGRTARRVTGDRDAAAALLHSALVKTYVAWPRVGPDGARAYAQRLLAGAATVAPDVDADVPGADPVAPPTASGGAEVPVDAAAVLEDGHEAVRGRVLGWTVALLTIGTVVVAFAVPPLIAALVP